MYDERILPMLTASTPALDLLEAYLDSDPSARVFPAFPINCFTGAEHTAVVYFEARLGDERGQVRAGDLAVIPAMVPHGIANTGEETLKVVGFFCESEITSTFV